MDSFVTFERLTEAGDLTSARLLVARLQGEGIDAVVRGEPTGPYPVTVGRMAVTEILVPTDQLAEAASLLQLFEEEAADIDVEPSGVGLSADLRISGLWWAVAVTILAFIIWARIVRFL